MFPSTNNSFPNATTPRTVKLQTNINAQDESLSNEI